MSTLPGFSLHLTGASGSMGLLAPLDSSRVFILPRGAFASASSTGNLITLDSAGAASRFTVGDWIQIGLSTSKIRQVGAVGGNSINLSGAAVTVSVNDRIFLFGSTEPTVVGGSATYTPNTIIRQRDDSAATVYTNSMVTTNANGLAQGFAITGVYDAIIQDGNRTNQGSIVDLWVALPEGISVSDDAFFGASVSVSGAIGVSGWATFGSSVTVGGNIGITGTAVFNSTVLIGSTLTANANAGITGTLAVGGAATFGTTVTLQGNLTGVSVTGAAVFGSSLVLNGSVGFTGAATFGATVSFNGNVSFVQGTSDFNARRFNINRAHLVGASYFVLSGWGATASVTVNRGSVDQAGQFYITTGGTTYSANPTINHLARDGDWITGAGHDGPMGVLIGCRTSPTIADVPIYSSGAGDLGKVWVCGVTPSSGQVYQFNYVYFGTSSL